MNRLVNRKSVLKSCNSGSGIAEKKQKKKEKCLCSPITKKGKNVRKSVAKVKKIVQSVNLLNEWAENESSKPEIHEDPRIFKNLHPVLSDDSVIYVGNCSENQLHSATPIIDLTQSPSNSLHENINVLEPKSFKTIYFPSRNFDRNIKLRKSMATTSLITLPIIERHKLPRKLNSTTILSSADKSKLGILDIPPQYLNCPDVSTDYKSFVEKSKLNKTDYKIIDWILNIETDIDISLSPSTSGYNSSLGTETSIEKINILYNTDSNEEINQNR